MTPSLHHWTARFLCLAAVAASLFGAQAALVSEPIRSPRSLPTTQWSIPWSGEVELPTTLADDSGPTTQPGTFDSVPTSQPAQLDGPRITIDAAQPICGFALCVHHISDLDLYLRSIDTVHAMGATSLEIVTPMFQYTKDAPSIRRLPDRCPTREQLIRLLTHAKSKGMHTTLLPIVLLERRGKGDWRGVISPRDWERWWDSYEEFLNYFIDIANVAHVDLLSVGSELNSTQGQLERWREVIASVRQQFDGQLTYSANWDRYQDVGFWSDLDAISVSSYFTLTDTMEDPTLNELVAGWRPHRQELLAYAASRERPLILSELGYPSLDWAGNQPWNYVARGGARADHDVQARCFDAFFRSWSSALMSGRSGAAGFYIYHWDPYHRGGRHDVRYGVDGKPARGVIEQHFRILRGTTGFEE